jgi:drug/metabolite transporter (DMT)-like permease
MIANPRALTGILFILAAVLVFACMDTISKTLAATLAPAMILGARYIVNLTIVVAMTGATAGLVELKAKNPKLALLRGVSLAAASFLAIMAFQRLPLAETISIIYLQPLLVTVFAGPVLGEKILFRHWAAAISGFMGVLLISRPGSGLSFDGVAFAMSCACVSVIYQLLSRKLVATEKTSALLFYTSLAGAIPYGLMLPWVWPAVTPALPQLVMLLSLGVLSLFGHYLYTSAYRHAPASVLAPVNYAHIFWAVILGYLVFGQIPDGLAFAGMVIIAVSGIGLALAEHKGKTP